MSLKMPKIAQTLARVLDNDNGAIEDKDRISLIKYSRDLRRVFTLVEKEKNFIQLKNQVEHIKVDRDDSVHQSQVAKALKATIVEFVRGSSYWQQLNDESSQRETNLSISQFSNLNKTQLLMNQTMAGSIDPETGNPYSGNKRWVICFTNSFDEEPKSGVMLEEIIGIFIKYQINLVLVCYDLSAEDHERAQDFTKKLRTPNEDGIPRCESYLLSNPKSNDLEELLECRLANFKIQKNSPLIIETFT